MDAAVWSDSPTRACAIVSAAVQQRLVTVPQLRDELSAAGRVPYRRLLAVTFDDIEGGAQSLLEIDLARLCRQAGLSSPERQAMRQDSKGRRRYLDAYWPRQRLCVEVDGAFHAEAEQWRQDLDRQNDLVADGDVVLRFSSSTVRLRPERV
nr:DUF559 domain-containing protein [Micromonospora sp. DSM 115978]